MAAASVARTTAVRTNCWPTWRPGRAAEESSPVDESLVNQLLSDRDRSAGDAANQLEAAFATAFANLL